MVIFFWIGFPVIEMVTGTYLREIRPKYSFVRQAGKWKTASSRSFMNPVPEHWPSRGRWP